jgi:hypothetical protein
MADASSSNTPTSTPVVDEDGDIVLEDTTNLEKLTEDQLKKLVKTLRIQNKLLKPTKKDMGVILKLQPPPLYDGKPKELRQFLTQLKAYFQNFESVFDHEEAKVKFAATRLAGLALKWFRPTWSDYIENEGASSDATQDIFTHFPRFEEELEKAFGDIGEKRMAENELTTIRQMGKCSDYAVRFQDLATHVHWGQPALTKRFYDGLKPEIKEKVYQLNREAHDLSSFMEECVQADNLLWELKMDIGKKTPFRGYSQGYSQKYQPNQGKKRYEEIASDNSGRPGRMDLSLMHKDQKGKRDFKCYNCGKPNHMARDCKSPKKEWKPVPEPKRSMNVMQKGDKSIHVLERDGDPDEYDDFYESAPELSDDSETQGREIPDRQPVSVAMVDYRLLTSITSENRTTTSEVNWERRNYGMPQNHQNSDDDEENFGRTDTPETHEIERFHQKIVEADHSIEGYTPIALYSYLDALNYEQRQQRFVRAVTTDIALQQNQDYQSHVRDHEKINPDHPRHADICWTNCITHRCMGHIKQKVTHDTFPIRIPFHHTTEVYSKDQHNGWRVTTRFRALKVTILEPYPFIPYECKQGGRFEDCTSEFCEKHSFNKVYDWHRSRELKQRREEENDCGKDQLKDCHKSKCWKHQKEKLINWHQSKNSARRL